MIQNRTDCVGLERVLKAAELERIPVPPYTLGKSERLILNLHLQTLRPNL